MTARVERDGLQVAAELAEFIEARALPGTGVSADAFWAGFSALAHELGPRNQALLDKREALQAEIDAWHAARRGEAQDMAAYRAFLQEIGYLAPEVEDFRIETENTDAEIATVPGPQLVVPVTNARYALNAANARWGSLYDALYGTDALGDLPQGRGYDAARGARVIAWGRAFLDEALPLAAGRHADVTGYHLAEDGALVPALKLPGQLVGYGGTKAAPSDLYFVHNGLHL
ncbi:malate synthase G, partial [Thioclava sp. BHET1]